MAASTSAKSRSAPRFRYSTRVSSTPALPTMLRPGSTSSSSSRPASRDSSACAYSAMLGTCSSW